MKEIAHVKFIAELHSFLIATAVPGSILTTKQIKKWIRGLDETHPVKVSYQEYVANCNSFGYKWGLEAFDRIANHMKYIPGYYQTPGHSRRLGYGSNVKFVTVKQNKIKI